MIEYVDHLHEHFVDPVRIRARPLRGADRRPGLSAELHRRPVADYLLPRRVRSGGREVRRERPASRGAQARRRHALTGTTFPAH